MPDTRPMAGAERGAKPHNPPTSCEISRHHADNMRKPPARGDGFRPVSLSTPCRKTGSCRTVTTSDAMLPRNFAPEFCPAILQRHRHDIIPVSCGQLREQRAFSVYRQRLAPPARQTGKKGIWCECAGALAYCPYIGCRSIPIMHSLCHSFCAGNTEKQLVLKGVNMLCRFPPARLFVLFLWCRLAVGVFCAHKKTARSLPRGGSEKRRYAVGQTAFRTGN